ncbi:YitT family protein [Halanaerobiaceae bacterium Z-7014]|uniref:YitT family protein n=1 Tax=Halonatronomonas betaini TaxID=2778430 RepID=A0A931AQD5_9FIRM|nr:YitT family protein [Halonatronomonas betaini]MBF8436577.1 YitT family protein [Halonatronomonas betaini]
MKNLRNNLKDYLIIYLGVLTVAIGTSVFLIPSNLAVGGITGLAIVVNHMVPQIPIGLFLIGMNIILLALGFWLIGSKFGLKTIFASLTLSSTIWIIESAFPLQQPLVDNIFLNLFHGILTIGIGLAIIFYHNASTGGTDILAKIINKYQQIEIGKSLLVADFLVTISAGITFGVELGLYALLGVIMNSFIIDYIIAGFNLKIKLTIITSNPEKIRNYINNNIQRGATIYRAEGAFTGEDKDVLITAMNRREFLALKSYIAKVDEDAFVMVSKVKEVFGEGFSY